MKFLLRLIRRLNRSWAHRDETEGSSEERSGYILSDTCQIPRLGMLYEQYFGFSNVGTFVEIGAYDGEYVSNTSGLADIGWDGYCVEPVPEYYDKCKKRHAKNPNVRVFNLAIGDTRETKIIHVGGPLSTMVPGMVDHFQSLPWAKGYHQPNKKTLEVQQVPMEDFLQEAKVPKGFEVLSIDVEGFEWNVLKGWDISAWKPKMVIIELHDQNENYLNMRDQSNRIVNYFYKHNYKVIYKNFSNTIYVPRGLYPLRGRTE